MYICTRLTVHFFLPSARKGEMQALQETHEAYQVIVKVIRAKNSFIRAATDKMEEREKVASQARLVASVFKKKSIMKKVSFD